MASDAIGGERALQRPCNAKKGGTAVNPSFWTGFLFNGFALLPEVAGLRRKD